MGSIVGHTDASTLGSVRDADDGNWRLSAMRADAARRALMEAGVEKDQVAEVIGMGDTAPLKTDDPYADVNRRISVTLLNKKSTEAVEQRAGGDGKPAEGEAGNNDREPVVNKAGSLLEQLRKEREARDNAYDNPPNQEELTW